MNSKSFDDQKKLIKKLQQGIYPILITGPTGSGKDYTAREMHKNSINSAHKFIAVNCSAIPLSLFESQIFGHIKGSFTGAHSDGNGYCKNTGEGTLFLDEIGDLPKECQPKLLRLLENRTYMPVGSSEEMIFKGRIIAATHKNLEELVEKGKFREDLYHRLSVFRLTTKPLSEQPHEIPQLVSNFFRDKERHLSFTSCAIKRLQNYPWKGNIRELHNTMERIHLLHDGESMDSHSLKEFLPRPAQSTDIDINAILEQTQGNKLIAIEQMIIRHTLEKNGGNKSAAARELGIERKQFERRLNFAEITKKQARKMLFELRGIRDISKASIASLSKLLLSLESLKNDCESEELQYRICSCISQYNRKRHGWGNLHSAHFIERMDAIAPESQLPTERIHHFLAIFGKHLFNCNVDIALQLGQTTYDNALTAHDRNMQQAAMITMANSHYWRGDISQSLHHLHLFLSTEAEGIPFRSEEDDFLQVCFLMLHLFNHIHLQKETITEHIILELKDFVESIGVYARAAGYHALTWGLFLLGRHKESAAFADECIHISRENSFTQYLAIGLLFKAHSEAISGDVDSAKTHFNECELILGKISTPSCILHGVMSLVAGEIAVHQNRVNRTLINDIEKNIAFYRRHHCKIYIPHLKFLLLRLRDSDPSSDELFELITMAQSQNCYDLSNRVEEWYESKGRL